MKVRVESLKYGVMFKKAFRQPDVFCKFVKDIVGKEICVDKVYEEYEFPQPNSKVRIRYDLFAEDTKNRVIVEIQNARDMQFFDRFFYYHSVAITEQVNKSTNYRLDMMVYTIVVLTTLPMDKTIDYSIAISNPDPVIQDGKRKGVMIDELAHKLIFVNPKVINPDTLPSAKAWLELIQDSLTYEVEEEKYQDPILQKVISEIHYDKISPIEAENIANEKSWDETKKQAFKEGKQEGEQIGIQKGEQIGIEKKQKEVIKNALKIGLDLLSIQRITGLSLEEIQKIQEMRD